MSSTRLLPAYVVNEPVGNPSRPFIKAKTMRPLPAMYLRNHRRKTIDKICQGAAAVEFAICLPVLVLIVLASIELTNFIYLKQSLTAAAYEGVREAVRRDGTDASTNTAIQQVLTARRIAGSVVRIRPGTLISPGELLTVEVTAPSTANRIIIPRFVNGMSARATATMMKQ